MDYKQKYLKYKSKYLSLKQQLGGNGGKTDTMNLQNTCIGIRNGIKEYMYHQCNTCIQIRKECPGFCEPETNSIDNTITNTLNKIIKNKDYLITTNDVIKVFEDIGNIKCNTCTHTAKDHNISIIRNNEGCKLDTTQKGKKLCIIELSSVNLTEIQRQNKLTEYDQLVVNINELYNYENTINFAGFQDLSEIITKIESSQVFKQARTLIQPYIENIKLKFLTPGLSSLASMMGNAPGVAAAVPAVALKVSSGEPAVPGIASGLAAGLKTATGLVAPAATGPRR